MFSCKSENSFCQKPNILFTVFRQNPDDLTTYQAEVVSILVPQINTNLENSGKQIKIFHINLYLTFL